MELNRNDSINFTLRMQVSSRLELEKIAKKEDRTVTNLINRAIKLYIDMYNNCEKEKGRD